MSVDTLLERDDAGCEMVGALAGAEVCREERHWMKTFRNASFLFFLVFVFLSSGRSLAQEKTIEQSQVDLLSPWLVTLGDESRARLLRITGAAQKADGTLLLEAAWGWVDGKLTPVAATASQTGQQSTMQFTTPGGAQVVVMQASNVLYEGTYTLKGEARAIKLQKLSEEGLQLKVAEAQSARATMAFAFEDKDWGIEPTTVPKTVPHAPTPTSIPGARVIKTMELKGLLDKDKRVVVIDVLESKTRVTIRGAFWMPGGGDGRFFYAEKKRFSSALEKLTAGDRTRPVVFLCLNSECWLSYNASLHALEAGYTNVIWYRGGTVSWLSASLELRKPKSVNW